MPLALRVPGRSCAHCTVETTRLLASLASAVALPERTYLRHGVEPYFLCCRGVEELLHLRLRPTLAQRRLLHRIGIEDRVSSNSAALKASAKCLRSGDMTVAHVAHCSPIASIPPFNRRSIPLCSLSQLVVLDRLPIEPTPHCECSAYVAVFGPQKSRSSPRPLGPSAVPPCISVGLTAPNPQPAQLVPARRRRRRLSSLFYGRHRTWRA